MGRRERATRDRENLRSLVRLYGIQPEYRNSRGNLTKSSEEALIRALAALGAPVRGARDFPDALEHRRNELGRRLVDPVSVIWQGSAGSVPLRLRPDERDGPLHFRFEPEAGEAVEWRADPRTLEGGAAPGNFGGLADVGVGETGAGGLSGPAWTHRIDPARHLPGEVPRGLHTLTVETGTRTGTTRMIVSPPTAHEPEGGTERGWGSFLPLHALRTRRSWGIGDFTDMGSLLSWTAAMGGRTVGTLPLLSTFLDRPFDPSPYAPVSRLFWNELYIDVERAPEMPRSGAARELLESQGVQATIRELRESPDVDYRRSMAVKRPILEALARTFLKDGPSSDFRTFLDDHPEVEKYARFRALVEQRGASWRQWPPELRDAGKNGSNGDDGDARVEHYHLYVQWLADRQMRALAEEGRSFGADLYLDLPLGTHPDGFDIWRHPEIFAEGVSGGAPPDDFFSGGQDWGFPPLHPERSRETGHAYMIDSIRTLMRFAGTLRLDHVMALHRLYWVPRGLGAADGVYVRYPAEELYAILCLESRRHRTTLVGEDLGTVPEEVRTAMQRHAFQRMYVVPFEISSPPAEEAQRGVEATLDDPPPRSVASLNTHDMPTFAAFWQGRDIGEREASGLLDAAGAREEEERRERVRISLLRILVREGALEKGGPGVDRPDGWAPRDGTPQPREGEEVPLRSVLRALLRYLAASPARLLLVNLEDLWLEERPQNLPGSPGEENWRRKAAHDLEVLSELPEVVEALSEVNRIREESAAEAAEGVGVGSAPRDIGGPLDGDAAAGAGIWKEES